MVDCFRTAVLELNHSKIVAMFYGGLVDIVGVLLAIY
jgi:hypothetical protein